MENGKQSFDQRSDNIKTIEDRDYFVLGSNIFNRSNYLFLAECLGWRADLKQKKAAWPAKVDPYWIDQLREGWKQWKVQISRDREILSIEPEPKLRLYYNASSPYCWWFGDKTCMFVITLAKDKEQAETHANKVLTQQYLNPKWLAMKANDDYYPYEPRF